MIKIVNGDNVSSVFSHDDLYWKQKANLEIGWKFLSMVKNERRYVW